MYLRERSVRSLREAARKTVPHALTQSFSDLEATLIRAVDANVAGLREYIVLAHNQLGAQLQALLERAAGFTPALPAANLSQEPASEHLPQEPASTPAATTPDPRRAALAELRTFEQRLEQLRGELARLAPTTEPA